MWDFLKVVGYVLFFALAFIFFTVLSPASRLFIIVVIAICAIVGYGAYKLIFWICGLIKKLISKIQSSAHSDADENKK